MLIYKIVDRNAWGAAEAAGVYAGSKDDLRDGFIHFSTGPQAPETARKHFAKQDELLLVAVDAASLGADLRWDVSRGGDRFPHLFAPLATSTVVWVKDLPLGPDGLHRFPLET